MNTGQFWTAAAIWRHSVFLQSARGLAQSKTLRAFQESSCHAQRLGVRRPSAAFFQSHIKMCPC